MVMVTTMVIVIQTAGLTSLQKLIRTAAALSSAGNTIVQLYLKTEAFGMSDHIFI